MGGLEGAGGKAGRSPESKNPWLIAESGACNLGGLGRNRTTDTRIFKAKKGFERGELERNGPIKSTT
jgi:hypothetical protein